MLRGQRLHRAHLGGELVGREAVTQVEKTPAGVEVRERLAVH